MTLSQDEFEAILANDTKVIVPDIHWELDENDPEAQVLNEVVEVQAYWELIICGRFNFIFKWVINFRKR